MTLYDDISHSLSYLSSTINANVVDSESHFTVVINGLDRSPEIIRHLAVYTVAVVSHAIEANLRISADLMEDNRESILEIQGCFARYIQHNNNYSTATEKRFIDRARNPWLAEVIVHMLLNISTTVRNLHPPGEILTTSFVHDLPTDNGLDAAALFISQSLGVVVVECKAYKNRPAAAFRDATNYYTNFNNNHILGKRIRTHVQVMRGYLTEEYRNQATNSFWKQEKSFVPTIFYDSSKNEDWSIGRDQMRNMVVNKDKRILVPIVIDNFHLFFNELSDAIRVYIGEMLQNV
ncbi:hypothetical protein [Cohnella hashimotonis]|uniref:DUF1837 domain-containing protein n=1 Tax=Cohnella hashimotonis TaxID=2826895 RepID=A0ABT6TPX2_9BACL|nr:hypothetical protein [Cohnella hashimotonis]MDI4648779.1 hypothetical protein [Cohnella hashimotonis]